VSGVEEGGAEGGWRLVGEVAGARRSYLVTGERYRLGKAADNDVVLPISGVSRRHALLARTADGLEIEDLGSRNGTFVGGRRIRRHRLAAGDRLRIGPVWLTLEAVPADDARLGLVLAAPGEAGEAPAAGVGPSPVSAPSETSGTGMSGTGMSGTVTGGASLLVVERVAAALAVSALGTGLEAFAEVLGGRGAALLEWGGAGPTVLAAAGEPGELAAPWLADAAAEADAATAGDPTAAETVRPLRSPPGEAPAAGCLLARPGAPARAVVVWGEGAGWRLPAPGAPGSLPRLFLRLVELRLPAGGEAAPAPAAPPELRLPDGFVRGGSPAMAALYAELAAVAGGELPVLLTGETGVGKEHLAHAVHRTSPRRDGPFVAVNCAAVPAELLEAELFGIGKGVATGVAERRGRFELADGGTLFLDEVGEMAPALQAKLLRALEEGEIEPVGRPPRPVDVRLVAATNADLEARMAAGAFRRDLFYRLAGASLRVPPLRERPGDLPALLEHFLRRAAGELGKTIPGVTVRALEALLRHPWPGNVRELEHEVRRLAACTADGQPVDSTLLRPPPPQPAGDPDSTPAPFDLEGQLAALERRLIREALARTGGNRTRAAELLGVSRQGLHLKLKRLDLDPGATDGGDADRGDADRGDADRQPA